MNKKFTIIRMKMLSFIYIFLAVIHISLVEVAQSFITSHSSSNKKCYQHFTYKCTTQSSQSYTASPQNDAILSESVMNNKLIEMGEEPIDFDLLKKTIAEWSRPLPVKYASQPLILVGPSGVGKGRLVKALLKDYQRFFVKLVTHTTRG
jgi:predicted AAA+ superfamily ATPase